MLMRPHASENAVITHIKQHLRPETVMGVTNQPDALERLAASWPGSRSRTGRSDWAALDPYLFVGNYGEAARGTPRPLATVARPAMAADR
jgi:hypothetical protein